MYYILFVLDLPFAVEETADLGEVAVPLHHVVQHGGLHQERVVTLYQEVYIFIGEQKVPEKERKNILGVIKVRSCGRKRQKEKGEEHLRRGNRVVS